MKLTPVHKRLMWAGAAAALVAAVWAAWHFAGSEPQRPSLPAPSTVTAPKGENRPGAPLPPGPGSTTPGMPAGPATQLVTVEEGDQMIDEIIRSDKPIPEMARDLSLLVQRLNGEAQVNASQHLVNLTSDEDYGLISGFLVDPKTNPDVIEVLFSDLMNRNRELQLPLFMNILRNPQHPQNEQTRHIMTILASEDFGNDYAAWDKWAAEELQRLKAEE